MAWEDSPENGLHPNLAKFLGFLGKAEGADYNTIVGGSSFNDFTKHPATVGLRTKEGPSTAAGRYQITKTTYDDVAPRIGVTDFSQKSQDLIAAELIRRGGALEDVLGGNYENAIKKLGGTWASLPSSPYSQPKRDWNFVKANLTTGSGWEDAPEAAKAGGGGGWEDAPEAATTTTAAPAAAAQPAAKAAPVAAPAPKKEEPRGVLRRVDDFVRGAADTLTFGYADEIAAKLDSLVGGGQSGKKAYDEALAAQRQRDKEGGGERVAGNVAGALLPLGRVASLAEKAPLAAKALAPILGGVRAAPTASILGRVGAGAATGAVQGALYGAGSAEGDLEDRLAGAIKGGSIGAVTGGVLGGVIPSSVNQKAGTAIKKAGSDADAALNAEVAIRAAREFNNPARAVNGALPALGAKELNSKVTNAFLREGIDAVEQLPKDSAVRKPFLDALRRGAGNTQDEIEKIASLPGGGAVVDIINKAQRADKMTAANPASNNMIVKALRVGSDYLLPGVISKPINYVLNNRKSREEVGKGVVKFGEKVAPTVLERTASARTQPVQEILEMAQKATSAKQAQVQLAKVGKEAAKDAAEQLRIRNLQLGIRSNPGFQPENLQITGGTRGTLQYYGRLADSKELAKGLRLIERTDPYLAPYIKQVQQNKNVPNKEILLGLTDRLKQMRDQGILKPYMKQ